MAKKTSTKKTTTKKTTKKASSKKTTSKKTTTKKASSRSSSKSPSSALGKKLVIVESPAKAKTINRYLGDDYIVTASVGHIRDLPAKNPKGVKAPVPGVDLEDNFAPSYDVLPGKEKTARELQKLAKQATEVWFATDKDREGEAIAWHLAELLKIDPSTAQRVVFNAITQADIQRAFAEPHHIDMGKVDAQQARRILDRIVGYQVSPLLWKKVARGLSAGRVQSVAVRLVVDRERAIRAHIPDESWTMTARFALDASHAQGLIDQWDDFIATTDERGKGPTIKAKNAWLTEHKGLEAELIAVNGKKFDISQPGKDKDGNPLETTDLTPKVETVAKLAGLTKTSTTTTENEDGKGPARFTRTLTGTVDPTTPYAIESIETKPTTRRPSPPFITSTLQQAASSFLGFGAQRTMRTAQRLYEGVNIKGQGQVALITYMRTDSTFISSGALDSARNYIGNAFGDDYLPDKPNFYKSSNKDSQEAHEAIRPTNVGMTPENLKGKLEDDQWKLYDLIWRRFMSCQMTPAKYLQTTLLIEGGTDKATPLTFRTSGRVLTFDGFTRVWGQGSSDEQTLPAVDKGDAVAPFAINTDQKFSPPPPRYSEAALIKDLESEGIGRPSTYASIIQVIQDRRYCEQIDRRFYATDLGEVVTDKLIEGFPYLMELGYTREMEEALDEIETENRDWKKTLNQFYVRFKDHLIKAEDNLTHAKAETQPAPKQYTCAKCDASTVYRFGKNGRFLSCSRYPDCTWACPVDRTGKPRPAEFVNVRCPKTGRPMTRRTGRFGPFITTLLEEGEPQDTGIILNIDKKGFIKAPSPPALLTELTCDKCGSPLNLRSGVRGPWLGCSTFPKCKGRGKWAELPAEEQEKLQAQLDELLKANPVPIIKTLDGKPLTDDEGRPLKNAPKVDELLIDDPAVYDDSSKVA